MITTRGMFNKDGELFGYLEGTTIFDLDDNQVGTIRDGVAYAQGGRAQWIIQDDGIFTLKGESIGYLGERFQE